MSNPLDAPVAFVLDVATLVQRWGIDVVMPGHEDAVVLREWEHLLPDGIRLACPGLAALCTGVDKASITRIAQAAGIAVPKTLFPCSVEEALDVAPSLGFPLVVKLAHSNSAKGVALVQSLDDLRTVLTERFVGAAKASGDQFPYLQAFHKGSVVGGCFMSRGGLIDGYFGERYLRAKSNGMGTSVFRELCDSAPLQSRVVRMALALKWDGIGHFDFIEDSETGHLVLLEMNPRPWGAINLAYINGFDFIGAAVAHTLGAQDLTPFFERRRSRSLRSMWVIGEGIRWAHLIAAGQFSLGVRAPLEILGSLRRTRFDDLIWHDPLPFLGEAICYGKGFLRSGGNFNPD